MAEVTKFKQYPMVPCLDEYHKDTVEEAYKWVKSIMETTLYIKTYRYYLQQTHKRWMSYHSLWGDPTEFEDYNALRALVKDLKSHIRWTHRPRPLMLKYADRYKKQNKKKAASK
jgi:hypothetical protein